MWAMIEEDGSRVHPSSWPGWSAPTYTQKGFMNYRLRQRWLPNSKGVIRKHFPIEWQPFPQTIRRSSSKYQEATMEFLAISGIYCATMPNQYFGFSCGGAYRPSRWRGFHLTYHRIIGSVSSENLTGETILSLDFFRAIACIHPTPSWQSLCTT